MASVLCCNDGLLILVDGSEKFKNKILKLRQRSDYRNYQKIRGDLESFEEFLRFRYYHYHDIPIIKEEL